jgi:hypothetical protein
MQLEGNFQTVSPAARIQYRLPPNILLHLSSLSMASAVKAIFYRFQFRADRETSVGCNEAVNNMTVFWNVFWNKMAYILKKLTTSVIRVDQNTALKKAS